MGRRTVVAAVGALGALVLAVGCDDDDGGGDLDAYCATAREFLVDNPAAAFSRVDPDDPAATATALRDAAGRLAAWAEQAPGEIDGDVDALAGAANELAEQFDQLVTAEEGTTLEGGLDLTAVADASERVVEFTRTECDVELDGPVSVSG